MSCNCCNANPCQCSASCDPNNEALASVLNNLTTSLIGVPVKSCVNNQVVWVLPCDLDNGIPEFPKNAGESIACYFLRFMSASGVVSSVGLKGYETTVLTNADVDVIAHTDVQDQDFTGTLTGPVSISLSSTGASAGDRFSVSLTGLVVGAVNSLTIKSDATTLFTFNAAGTLTGAILAVYTGTVWKITLNSVDLS